MTLMSLGMRWQRLNRQLHSHLIGMTCDGLSQAFECGGDYESWYRPKFGYLAWGWCV